jgi:hypothetical protein
MIDNPTIIMLESMNEIFPPPGVNPNVKVSCVGITLFEIRDSRSLPLPSSHGHGHANNLSFQSSSKVKLVGVEHS